MILIPFSVGRVAAGMAVGAVVVGVCISVQQLRRKGRSTEIIYQPREAIHVCKTEPKRPRTTVADLLAARRSERKAAIKRRAHRDGPI